MALSLLVVFGVASGELQGAATVVSSGTSSITHGNTAAAVTVVDLPVPKAGKTGFTLLRPEATGINPLADPAQHRKFPLEDFGNAGLAAGDVDGDGWVDLYICGMDGPNLLYRNLGNWKFEDITARAGVACSDRILMGAVFVDVDGDGDLDLIVVSMSHRNALFLNDGKGHFTEDKRMPWVNSPKIGFNTAALADVDGDGDLDLYITSDPQSRFQDTLSETAKAQMVHEELAKIDAGKPASQRFLEMFEVRKVKVNGRMEWQATEKGSPHVLYLNKGNGTFTRVTDADQRFLDESGKPMAMPYDWGWTATFRDVNGDGAPDLYVCNDFQSPDRFWINDGTGRFRLIDPLAVRRTCYFAMGVDFADINRDGHVDFMTLDMLSRDHTRRKTQMGDMVPTPITIGEIANRPQIMQNTLFLSRGDGTYTEMAQYAGVKASEWSWSVIFLDVDLDGYEDLLITTGMERDIMDSDANKELAKLGPLVGDEYLSKRKTFPRLKTPNFIFRNRGDLRFEDRSAEWGFTMGAVSGGMLVADLDNDGDLDVVINNLGSPTEVYRNETVAMRVAVRLKGLAPNTRGIGAKIKLLGGPVAQSQEVICGGVYASGSDPLRVFAAGQTKAGMKLEVTWRNGKVSEVEGVRANRLYVIDERSARSVVRPRPVAPSPVFADVSARLKHQHHDDAFDDFARQPLLPNRLSQLGPGVAWFDLDGDGREDLIIGSGRGGSLAVYRNDGQGGFQELGQGDPLLLAARDQTGVVGWSKPDGKRALLVGSSNFETGLSKTPVAHTYEYQGSWWKLGPELAGQKWSSGPLALGDVDGDGALDLVVCGRSVAGRYPEPAGCVLYVQRNGKFEVDERNRKVLAEVGLVSGAVLGDVDGDGAADLVLACEWGPVRVYLNEKGVLREATSELGLSSYPGWWNSVTLGDVDGDGQLDIVAGNWGQNSKYEHAYNVINPLKIYYGDFDGSGTVDIVETHYDRKMRTLVPERGLSCSSRAMPFIRDVTPTFLQFGSSGLEQIYGERLKGARVVEANTLASMVFMNRGKKFEARALPVEAQMAPVFGVSVGDYDGDGVEDVFMGQNFFAVQIETPRNDGGRGLWLRGEGQGKLTSVAGQESGIQVYGEARGSALCDYDGDGRVDVVVSQNGAETKLYRNVGGKAGLRVRLKGAPGNPEGIGAVLRLEYAGGSKGPARAVLAGSGYWSQDAAVQVLGKAGEPVALHVRWPGGKDTRTVVPANAQEMVVQLSGELARSR